MYKNKFEQKYDFIYLVRSLYSIGKFYFSKITHLRIVTD